MDVLRQHEIAEAGHRILNPFTEEKLELLGQLCRWRRDMRLLDLCSGKGEMLCTWSHRHGIRGLGVDISEVFVPAARDRAAHLGVADRAEFVRADASTFGAEPGVVRRGRLHRGDLDWRRAGRHHRPHAAPADPRRAAADRRAILA